MYSAFIELCCQNPWKNSLAFMASQKHIYKTALTTLENYWAPQPVVFHWDDSQSSSSGVSTDSVPSLIDLD